jgi:hypothetical protein
MHVIPASLSQQPGYFNKPKTQWVGFWVGMFNPKWVMAMSKNRYIDLHLGCYLQIQGSLSHSHAAYSYAEVMNLKP